MRNLELDSKRMKNKKKRRENEVEVKNEEKSHERNPGDGKKKRRRETKNNGELVTVSEANSLVEAETVKKMKKKKQRKEIVAKIAPVEESDHVDDGAARQSGKSMKSKKDKKKNKMKPEVASEGVGMQRKTEKQEDVYCLSSGDEDCSKGMKKWLTEYNESRPGLRALQQRIDDFIISHEEKLEEEKREREAQAADGGWTVVVHQRGRKKTTDPESGIAVGSAVPVAKVDDITTKKKRKEIGVDFYRFQKREAHMNEILQLQSKFEEDKKRIQQLRAARKFRPY